MLKISYANLLLAGVLGALQVIAVTPAIGAETPPPSCAASGKVTPLCGIQAPEDLEITPDGRHLVISETPGVLRHAERGGIALLDLATDKRQPLVPAIRGEKGWGDPSCRPIATFAPHGISLARRSDKRLQLLVVNHAERESVEMFELIPAGSSYSLVWRGCIEQPDKLAINDVAATANGFIATIPDGKLPGNAGRPLPLNGVNTGYLMEWTAGTGFRRLPRSEAPFNNGVQIGPDGRFIYFAAWTSKEVRKYDRRKGRVVATVSLDFHPDNLTTRQDGALVAAGVAEIGALLPCIQAHDAFCPTGFGVGIVDPDKMTATSLHSQEPGLLAGASVALQREQTLYVGAFTGDRILKLQLGD